MVVHRRFSRPWLLASQFNIQIYELGRSQSQWVEEAGSKYQLSQPLRPRVVVAREMAPRRMKWAKADCHSSRRGRQHCPTFPGSAAHEDEAPWC
jgi:hypothetical protein